MSQIFRTIAIEGNIGSGKTTLISNLQQTASDIEFILEPVDKWKNCDGTNLLAEFYADPKRKITILQAYIALTFLRIGQQPCPFNKRITERTCLSAQPFLDVALQTNMISYSNHEFCTNILQSVSSHVRKPDVYIYLQTDPVLSLQRLQRRNRTEEADVPLQYLQNLNKAMNSWIQGLPSPVVIINANQEMKDVLTDVKTVLQLYEFITPHEDTNAPQT